MEGERELEEEEKGAGAERWRPHPAAAPEALPVGRCGVSYAAVELLRRLPAVVGW
jgi:hypothetical protein